MREDSCVKMWKLTLCIIVAFCTVCTNAKENNTDVHKCRLSAHPSVEYLCKSGESTEPCGEHVAAGTIASAVCREGYFTAQPLTYMTCIDGVWNYVAFCQPECGTVVPQGGKLKRAVQPASRGEVPWHVAIYTKQNEPYRQICGGSLVSASTVITAAHCFWATTERRPQPASQYVVAVGNLNRPWSSNEQDGAQTSDVREISIPQRFQGAETNFQSDIAVVTLSTPVQLKPHIRPVCLDFDVNFERKQLQPGALGKVAFWNPSSEPRNVLKVVQLPYVDIVACISEAPNSFRALITSDKICAYSKDPSEKICPGAGGGGLAFPETHRGVTRYYLRGVISVAAVSDDETRCSNFVAQTKVLQHEHFIKENIAA